MRQGPHACTRPDGARSRPADRGFTLIELMILVVVGIILAGVALPAPHTMDDERLRAAARILEADLQFAQARAIATGQNHRVLFGTTTYQVESPPGVLIEEPLNKVPWVRVLEEGIQVLGADFNGEQAVVYDPSGEPSSGGTVVLENGPFLATLTVAAVTGEIDLELP